MVSTDAPAPAGLRLAASAGWAHRRVGAESLELFHRCPSADLPQGRDGAGRNAIDTDERPILLRFVFIRPRASGVSEVHLRRVKATYDIFIGKEAEVIETIHRHHRLRLGNGK